MFSTEQKKSLQSTIYDLRFRRAGVPPASSVGVSPPIFEDEDDSLEPEEVRLMERGVSGFWD